MNTLMSTAIIPAPIKMITKDSDVNEIIGKITPCENSEGMVATSRVMMFEFVFL